MKYTYSKSRKFLKSRDKLFIDSVLEAWKKHDKRQNVIINNFKKEHFLSVELYLDLFKLLIAKGSTTSKDVYEITFDYFKKYFLSGGSPNIPKISKLGFVLTEYSVIKNLEDNYIDIFNGDLAEIHYFIDNLRNNNIDEFFDFLSIKKLREALWITFDSITDNPFCFLQTNSRDEVYVSLALNTHYRDGPILLFTIDLDNQIENLIRKATVFDAGDYKYFRPPPPNFKDYGYTNPHNRGKITKNKITNRYSKRPEIICDSREIKYRHLINVQSL